MFSDEDDFNMDEKFWEEQLQEENLQTAQTVNRVKRKSFDLNPGECNISSNNDPLGLNSLLHKRQRSECSGSRNTFVEKSNPELRTVSRTEIDDLDLNDNLLCAALDTLQEVHGNEKCEVTVDSEKVVSVNSGASENQFSNIMCKPEIKEVAEKTGNQNVNVVENKKPPERQKEKTTEVLFNLQFSPGSFDGDVDLSLNVSPSWKPTLSSGKGPVDKIEIASENLTAQSIMQNVPVDKSSVISEEVHSLNSSTPELVINDSIGQSGQQISKRLRPMSSSLCDEGLAGCGVQCSNDLNISAESINSERVGFNGRTGYTGNQSNQVRDVLQNSNAAKSTKMSTESTPTFHSKQNQSALCKSSDYPKAKSESKGSDFRVDNKGTTPGKIYQSDINHCDTICSSARTICKETRNKLPTAKFKMLSNDNNVNENCFSPQLLKHTRNISPNTSEIGRCFTTENTMNAANGIGNNSPQLMKTGDGNRIETCHRKAETATPISEEFNTPSKDSNIERILKSDSGNTRNSLPDGKASGRTFSTNELRTPSTDVNSKNTPVMGKRNGVFTSGSIHNINTPTSSHVSGGKRKRKFPGPAGVLPKLKDDMDLTAVSSLKPASPAVSSKKKVLKEHCELIPSSQGTEDRFQDDLWLSMKADLEPQAEEISSKYCLAEVIKLASKKQLPRGKVPVVCAVIEMISTLSTDASVLLRDTSGLMKGTIHRQLVKDYPTHLVTGTVLVLRQCGVFSPSPRSQYLNITANNMVRIYWKQADGQSCSLKLSKFVKHDFVIPEPKIQCSKPMNTNSPISSTPVGLGMATSSLQRPLFGSVRINSPINPVQTSTLPRGVIPGGFSGSSPRYQFKTPTHPTSLSVANRMNTTGRHQYPNQIHRPVSHNSAVNSIYSSSISPVGLSAGVKQPSNRLLKPMQIISSKGQDVTHTSNKGESNSIENGNSQAKTDIPLVPLTCVNNVNVTLQHSSPATAKKMFSFKKSSPGGTINPGLMDVAKTGDPGGHKKQAIMDFSLHNENLDDLLTGMEDELLTDM